MIFIVTENQFPQYYCYQTNAFTSRDEDHKEIKVGALAFG